MTIHVNGEEIPESVIQYELDRLVKFYSEHMSAEEIKNQMDALRQKAVQQAVGSKLLMQEARKLDFNLPESDIDEAIEEMAEKLGSSEALAEMMTRQGLSETMLRDSIRRGRQVDLLVDRITEDAPEPTEDEIREHFESHSEEYQRPDRSAAQHILRRPASDSEADRKTVVSQLLEIRNRVVEEDKDFGDEAAVHSECPSGKSAMGSLGWFSRGMMVPEFDAAVFAMEVDEISDPVETPLGFHLIRKTGHEDGGPAEFDDVREKIRDFLRHVTRGKLVAAYVAELTEKAEITNS